jgi:prophage regulatory protein
MKNSTSEKPKIISLKELLKRVPYSAVQIWRIEKIGLFPKRVKLGPRRIGWVESEIDEWIKMKMLRRDL